MDGVSLILCCHNSSSKLGRTLGHIDRQQSSRRIDWELVIVDNASSDGTYQVASELTKNSFYNCKIVNENKIGLKNARLKGVEASNYEFISFIDDDNWICPDWVQTVFDTMSSKPDVGACGGGSEPAFDSVPPVWFEAVHESFAVGRQCSETGYVPDSRGYLWGGGLTIRRTAWNNLLGRGFDFLLCGRKGNKLTSGEDTELCLALRLNGWKLWYEERLKFVHHMPDGRLNLNYLHRLYRAFGHASPILNYYRYILEAPSADRRKVLKGCLVNSMKSLYDSVIYLTEHWDKLRSKIDVEDVDMASIYEEYELGKAISSILYFPLVYKHFSAIYALKAPYGR